MYCTKTILIIAFDFVMLLRARENAIPSNSKHALQCLMQFEWDVFPTLCIAYRLLLTIGFSIASCERSFSKLKLIKTCIRSYMLHCSGSQTAVRVPLVVCESFFSDT